MEAKKVAEYIIAKYNDVGDLVTNKKLQKILYYVKAWGLVYFDDGVIDDSFEAWVHGPVCRSVYQEYKSFGYNPLTIDYGKSGTAAFIRDFKGINGKTETDKEKIEMIDAVFNKYGKLTSLQLELLTHSELPWIEAREGFSPIDPCSNEIKEDTMRSFYSKKN